MKGRFQAPKLESGKIIKPPNQVMITDYDYPIFCFKHLHKDYCLEQCNADQKIGFVEKIIALSSQNWTQLQLTSKHGLGSEKIARSSINPAIPPAITEDVTFFLSFRFHGKAPMVGYRNKFIFHIVYIDPNFQVYKH